LNPHLFVNFRQECVHKYFNRELVYSQIKVVDSNEDAVQSVLRRNAIVGLLLLACHGAFGQVIQPDLTKLNLADLMNIEVTSVSKKEQKLSRTASAVFVIAQDDIRRSGATNVPDLLRMVPGVDVAQIDANKWAISVRGFNGQYSNKLLVLIDGRTVYSPMFSGVFWDAQDVPLDSIERIEVIRGPGATVWGANAVNGVINIITKKASDTQGGLLTAGGGTAEHGFGTVRYGGKLGSKGAYRVSADGFARDHFPDAAGGSGQDGWDMVHGGFRIDANASARDSITLEGDTHRGDAGELVNSVASISPPVNSTLPYSDRFSGWNLSSKWDHVASPHSATSLQVYFDRSNRGDSTYGIGLNVFDLDFQHHVGWGERQDIVWGLGYRLSSDDNATTQRIAFNPTNQTTHLFSSFVQDEITIVPDRVYLSLGVKLEHNDYTGLGLQPSARISWTVNNRNMLWAAVSEADRTPARSDTDIRDNAQALPGPNGLPLLVSFFGNPKFKDEELRAVEAGYRTQLTPRVSLSGTVFLNNYRSLSSVEPGAPFLESGSSPLHLVIPNSFSNLMHGETHGLETFANWSVTSRWSLSPGYSFLTMHLHHDPLSKDLTTAFATEGGSPNHQAQLRSHVDLPSHLGWNAAAYFVGPLPARQVPSYTRLDSNLTWQAAERFSITLVGENLLRDHHLEYTGPDLSLLPSLIKRSVYAKFIWQF
jgi:iron complex outermembrane recepter protein